MVGTGPECRERKELKDRCPYCAGYGYVQVYQTTVMRVYCDCEAGDRNIERVRKALEEVGLDPDNPDYRWTRRSEVFQERSEHWKKET